MTFVRLDRGHAVAAVAALCLLLAMAVDWYSTDEGAEVRRIEAIQGEPAPGEPGQVTREVLEGASIAAEDEERNAWQAAGDLDRIVLAVLLASVVLALGAAALRAAGRRYPGPLDPSVLAASVAALATLLIALRIVQVGAIDAGGVVKVGAPVGLVAAAAIAIGSALAARAERAQSGAEQVEARRGAALESRS